MEYPHIVQAGHAPEVTKVQTVLVYHGGDGRIVHKHEVVTLAGGTASSDERVAADALEHARRRGHAAEALAVHHVDGGTLKRNVGYRIDPATRRLVEQPR
jgi:hypothetical protein